MSYRVICPTIRSPIVACSFSHLLITFDYIYKSVYKCHFSDQIRSPMMPVTFTIYNLQWAQWSHKKNFFLSDLCSWVLLLDDLQYIPVPVILSHVVINAGEDINAGHDTYAHDLSLWLYSSLILVTIHRWFFIFKRWRRSGAWAPYVSFRVEWETRTPEGKVDKV